MFYLLFYLRKAHQFIAHGAAPCRVMSRARDRFFLCGSLLDNTFTVALIILCVPRNSVPAKLKSTPHASFTLCLPEVPGPTIAGKHESENPRQTERKPIDASQPFGNTISHLGSFEEPRLSCKRGRKRESVSPLRDSLEDGGGGGGGGGRWCTVCVCVYMSK